MTIPSVLVVGVAAGLAVALLTPMATTAPSFATMQGNLSSKNADLRQSADKDASTIASDQKTIDQLNGEAQAVKDQSAKLDAREAAVKAREDAVGVQENVIAANTFQGDGTYIVGKDIQPGQYRSAGGASCYWVRQDANGGILDNNLGSGPAVLTVRSTDATLRVSRCAPFTKVG